MARRRRKVRGAAPSQSEGQVARSLSLMIRSVGVTEDDCLLPLFGYLDFGRYVLPGGVSVRYPQVRSSLAGESLDILL